MNNKTWQKRVVKRFFRALDIIFQLLGASPSDPTGAPPLDPDRGFQSPRPPDSSPQNKIFTRRLWLLYGENFIAFAVFDVLANTSSRQHVVELQFLSVQCNTLHVTEYKVTCGECLSVSVCAHGTLGSNISKTLRDRA